MLCLFSNPEAFACVCQRKNCSEISCIFEGDFLVPIEKECEILAQLRRCERAERVLCRKRSLSRGERCAGWVALWCRERGHGPRARRRRRICVSGSAVRVWYLPALVICSYQGVATSCVKIRSFALHLQGGLDKSWAALWNRLLAASIQYLRGCFLPEGLQTGPLLGSFCSGGSLLDYSRWNCSQGGREVNHTE